MTEARTFEPLPLEILIEEARERERRIAYRPPEPPQQDGKTFSERRDGRRLNGLMRRIIRHMEPPEGDEIGKWFTPDELEEATGRNYASIQARLRDSRKPKFACPWYAQSKSIAHGLWVWRLVKLGCPTYWIEIMEQEPPQ